MSEPIKNTLFRFATMRTPELIPEKDKRDYHIHHPNPTTTGFFANALANPAATQAAQLQALTTLAAGFTALKTTAEAKTYLGDNFFDFSVWLAKNHTAVFNKTATAYSGTMPTVLTSQKIIGLWDNLFFQLIKGISPQLRQFFIELLVANGYLAAENAVYKNQLAVARVIIPAAFYGAGAVNPLAPFAPEALAAANASVNTGNLKKLAAANIANEKIKVYTGLLEELKHAEKKYAKQNKAAYDITSNEYNATVKNIINGFNNTNPNPNPQPAPAVEPEKEPAGLNLPQFDFTPAPEMESSFLQSKLSAQAFAQAQQLGLPDNTSFSEAEEIINSAIADEAKKTDVLNEGGNQSIVLNNMIFPVNRGAEIIYPLYSFYMETLYQTGGKALIYCSLYVGVPDEYVVSAGYHAEINNTTFSGTTYTQNAVGNYLFLSFYTPAGLQIPAGVTQFRFHGTLTMASSIKLKFDIQYQVQQGTSGIMVIDEPEEGGGQTTQSPSGYGIKRIGLADYRRVEQSVCCYLPGEVSHIENVMAREYKERSTRRLSRSEDTTVSEKSMEKETQKDTSSTERYELQKEIDSVITKDTSFEAHANVTYSPKTVPVTIDAGASFATNTSKEDSNHTAINYSKEVTEKALERVVQKIREERTIKIIEEFEEQNKHGYDNRQGDQHISGVYRWIDKVYKNQVFNYGKRLMYEFMIPEPAVFHNEAIKVLVQTGGGQLLTPPIDPRMATANKLTDYSQVNDTTLAYWSGMYNVEVPARLDDTFRINKAFEMNATDAPGRNYTGAKSYKLELPEGYEATSASISATFQYHPDRDEASHANIRIGDTWFVLWAAMNISQQVYFYSPIRKEIGISVEVRDLGGLAMNIAATCKRTPEALRQWQIECFNVIINAYQQALDAYNKAYAAQKKPDTVINLNPGFYRQIENSVLRKTCISYLITHDKMGKDLYKTGTSGAANVQVNVDGTLDSYSSMVKFIEQAFEWEIMSYKFYPFYWGKKESWQKNYQQEVDDPIFRSFLQAGMARTIVSIRPGFEEAVMYFMATGKIWNGGQVPAIGDDLYLSIVEELKNPTYYIDETWETRVPTTLTVIQSGNIGLKAEGLPCACGDENDIEQNDNKLGVTINRLGNEDNGPAKV